MFHRFIAPFSAPFPHPSRVGESISTSGVFSDKHILSMDKMVFTNYQYSLVKNPILAILIIAIIQRPVFYSIFDYSKSGLADALR